MKSLEELNKDIKKFCDDRDWSQFHDPKNLALSLHLESAEVLELFQWTQDNEINPDKKDKLSGELADVFYWLLLLSSKYDIDITNALIKKMKENEMKYPVEKARGVSTKYTDL